MPRATTSTVGVLLDKHTEEIVVNTETAPNLPKHPVISQITDPNEIVEQWSTVQKVPALDGSPATLLAKCLNSVAVMLKGTIDNEVKALLIYEFDPLNRLIVQFLYAPHYMLAFQSEFVNLCKRIGVREFYFTSPRDGRLFSQLKGVKKMYTWFRVEVG